MIAYIEMADEFLTIVEASLKDMRIYKPRLTVRSLSDGMLAYEIPLMDAAAANIGLYLQYSADGTRLVFNDTFSLTGYEKCQ